MFAKSHVRGFHRLTHGPSAAEESALFGLPGVGWWAHIGGFAAGALVGLGYRIVADTRDDPGLPLAA